jgi:hypothetical protein
MKAPRVLAFAGARAFLHSPLESPSSYDPAGSQAHWRGSRGNAARPLPQDIDRLPYDRSWGYDSMAKPPKPPKPTNREAAPRFRGVRPVSSGKSVTIINKLNALAELTKKEMDIADFGRFAVETSDRSSHRAAAILLVINLELILDVALRDHLVYDRSKKLFKMDCALGTFRNKIHIAHALNMFGDEMFNNLEIMRCIRNAFAHAHVPIDFDTEEVRAAVDALVPPKLLPPHVVGAEKRDISQFTGFKRFRAICEDAGHNLHAQLFYRPIKLKAEFIDSRFVEQHPLYEVIARPPPLP